jgi:hypothetical protein
MIVHSGRFQPVYGEIHKVDAETDDYLCFRAVRLLHRFGRLR